MVPPVTEGVVLRGSNREEDSMNLEPSQSGKQIVGIIYPPPEIRNIVDKTATFVARNGADFENRIRQNEAGNEKFNFLTPTNPYHAYYQSKVKEFRDGAPAETAVAKPTGFPKIQEAVKQAEAIPTVPPPDFEFSAEPATINAYELDLMKITALFCARNGRQFMTQVMTREQRNYQFDFLKPQHSNFPYFTKLVEQYTKVLIPPKTVTAKLESELADPKKVLDSIKYRVSWQRHQKKMRERQEAALEKERLAYAAIDWHDFVVVQTVDFQPNETTNLPPPCTPKDVGARILAQARIETQKATAVDIEMEMEDSDEEKDALKEMTLEDEAKEGDESAEKEAPPAPPSNVLAPLDTVAVRKGYNPHSKRVEQVKAKASEKWVISPLTGERIPADKLEDHMRFNTVDSQYFMQREKELAEKSEEPIWAPGVDIFSNIRKFADRRSDIFGVGSKGAEQTIIGETLTDMAMSRGANTSQKDEATWAAGSSRITIEQQLADIKRVQGNDGLEEEIKRQAAQQQQSAPKPGVPANMTGSNTTPLTQRPRAPVPQPPAALPRPALIPQAPQPTVMPMAATALQSAGMQQPYVLMPVMPQMRPPPMQMPQTQEMGGMTIQMGMMQSAFGMNPYPPPHEYGDDGEPASKRQKAEDNYVAEYDWMKMHNGTISIVVQLPVIDDKSEWDCHGQVLHVPLHISEPMSALKQKIQEAINMPSSKQKLSVDGVFVKDTNSLAYYNLLNGSVVQLSLKERGGRKK